MRINRIVRIATAAAFALLLGLPAATAQESGMDHSKHAQMQKMEQKAQGADASGTKCQMMDAKLDRLVERMNAATGPEKIAAMQELLTELVAQRKSMHTMMRKMMQKKMGARSSGEDMPGGDTSSRCGTMKKQKMQQAEEAGEDTSGR